MRKPNMTAALMLCALVAQGSGCRSSFGWPGSVKWAPGTPGDEVVGDPAKAVLLRFLPGRADDAGFLELVDHALRSSRGQKIAEEGASSLGELDAIRDEITARGLPGSFVGIPMWESYLDTEAVSQSCAAGAWQLMPETAVELGLQVQDCRIGDLVWTPSPGSVASPDSPYRWDGGCGITACAVDERTDLARSSVAALDLLEKMFQAPDLTRNPDRSALTVLAYNTGLGNVRTMVDRVFDPFAEIVACADNDCGHMGRQGAEYVPGVIAAAALSTCAAAQIEGSPFTPEARTGMCRSLGDAGLLPSDEPVVADAAE
ncbi:MAG: transglycosylase SLT domain-containing protein [Myxococcota bacterium]